MMLTRLIRFLLLILSIPEEILVVSKKITFSPFFRLTLQVEPFSEKFHRKRSIRGDGRVIKVRGVPGGGCKDGEYGRGKIPDDVQIF